MSTVPELMPDIIRYSPLFGRKQESFLNPVPEKARAVGKVAAELLARLNELARAYPFNIMYRSRNNDPL